VNILTKRSGSTGFPAAGVGLGDAESSAEADEVPDATVGLEGLLESVPSSPHETAEARTSGTSAAAAVRRTRSWRFMARFLPDRPTTLLAD
jgi:hypothetical protein